jgi:hypothetical protein
MAAEFDRGPYDGYISEVADGWEVAAHGVLIDTVADEAQALVLLGEHCASRPRWRVDADGVAELISE